MSIWNNELQFYKCSNLGTLSPKCAIANTQIVGKTHKHNYKFIHSLRKRGGEEPNKGMESSFSRTPKFPKTGEDNAPQFSV